MNIFSDGVLVDINVSYWSGAKILTAKDLGLKEEEIAEAFSLGRKMLVPREIIRKFRAIESKARFIVERNSFKFPIGNARFIPKKKFPKVFDALKEYQQEYNALVNTLITNYNSYRKEMIPVYAKAAEIAFMKQLPSTHEFSIEDMEKDKYDFVYNFLTRINSHYPDAESLRGKFSLDWDIYEIALPRMKKGNAESIADNEFKKQIADEEYRTQAQEKIGNFIEEVVTALRNETVSLCTHVIDNITKGKIVRKQTLKSINDFIDNFRELNFVGDQKIEDQLDSLKKDFLDAYSPKNISKRTELKVELVRRLHDLSEVAANVTDVNSVTGEYRRKVDWQD